MLKKDPKPNTPAGAPPEVDPYILTFWKNRIDLLADNQLKHLRQPYYTPLALLLVFCRR